MTRQDFNQIASIINAMSNCRFSDDEQARVALHFAEMLKKTNPRFNEAWFIRAVNGDAP